MSSEPPRSSRSARQARTDWIRTSVCLLREKGATPEAYTFRQTFPPPDRSATEQPGGFADECPAT